MKLQHLTIIFIIIIIPITIATSEYVKNIITIEETKMSYDTKLYNSTYDAVKAFQLNNVNNAFSDVSTSKVKDIEAAANVFYSSLLANFNYSGQKKETMQDYVPALVFTLYDGYYIYSPFTNTLTTTSDENNNPKLRYYPDYSSDNPQDPNYPNVDSNYPNAAKRDGLKPYVYYSCRYSKDGANDIVITYTLDNYITVQGIVGGVYVNKSGYLLSGITKSTNGYIYDEIEFKKDTKEEMKEYLLGEDKQYSYVKINGVKYYYNEGTADDGTESFDGITINSNASIFYIEEDGSKNNAECPQYKGNEKRFKQFYNAIFNNNSAYIYYKEACEFTEWVEGNLSWVSTSYAKIYDSAGTKLTGDKVERIFGMSQLFKKGEGYQFSNSTFNNHRQAVIRNVLETNLSTAIKSFSPDNVDIDFIMPKISESDWEIVENNVCCISFLQGLSLVSRKYNGYSVVANTLTKEYVDENDIYILKNDGTYCRANDNSLNQDNIVSDEPIGKYKMDFQLKKGIRGGSNIYYNSTCYKNVDNNIVPYKGSYTSIMGDSGILSTSIGTKDYPDMYTYMTNMTNIDLEPLKRGYYMALGRERLGSYNIQNINLDGRVDIEYYFKKFETP